MPYVDPQSLHNPATGTSPPASWGDNVRDNIVWLAGDGASGGSKPMCRVYNTSNFALSTTSLTLVTFNAERFDVGGMHSTASNTGRITVPTGGDGVYAIGAHVLFQNTDIDGYRRLQILLNGTTTIALHDASGSVGGSGMSVATAYKLSAGDWVGLYAFQDSGSTINLEAGAAYSLEFWAYWVGVG